MYRASGPDIHHDCLPQYRICMRCFLCHTNKVTATVWANTLGFKDCQIDTKTGITKKSTEIPINSIDMEFTDSSIEDVAEFVRRRLYSEQSVEVKTVKKLASGSLNMRPMRFNI